MNFLVYFVSKLMIYFSYKLWVINGIKVRSDGLIVMELIFLNILIIVFLIFLLI